MSAAAWNDTRRGLPILIWVLPVTNPARTYQL